LFEKIEVLHCVKERKNRKVCFLETPLSKDFFFFGEGGLCVEFLHPGNSTTKPNGEFHFLKTLPLRDPIPNSPQHAKNNDLSMTNM
jgi:hypothetical protein